MGPRIREDTEGIGTGWGRWWVAPGTRQLGKGMDSGFRRNDGCAKVFLRGKTNKFLPP